MVSYYTYPSVTFFIQHSRFEIYLHWCTSSALAILLLCSIIPNVTKDFPGGPVVKNPPSNAGDVGLIPGWGTKIPHAMGQLSPHATTTEPTSLKSPHAVNFRAHAPQLGGENPHATTRE